MFCTYCGAKVSDESLFCTSCGNPLKNAENSALAAENPENSPVLTAVSDETEEKNVNVLENTEKTQEERAPYSPNVPDEINSNTDNMQEEAPYSLAEKADKPVNSADTANAEYIAPVIAAEQSAPKAPKAGKAKTALISVGFGILIMLFLFTAEVLTVARITLRDNKVSEALTKVNPADTKVGTLLKSPELAKALEDIGVDTENFTDSTTLSEFLAYLSIDLPMTGEDVAALFEETNILSELSLVAEDYEKYLLTGSEGDYLSSKKVMSIINSRRQDIKKYTGVDIDLYSDRLEEVVDSLSEEIESINPENSLGSFGKLAYIFLSPVTIALTVIAAIIFGALIGTSTKKPFAAILTLGICFAASGLIMFICSVFNYLVIALVMPFGESFATLLSKLFRLSLSDQMMLVSLIFLGIGALLIGAKIIQNLVIKKRNKKTTGGTT